MHPFVAAAESLIHKLCQDKDGWEFAGITQLVDDRWGADCFLVFRRQISIMGVDDDVTCYVGFRDGSPLYVLQTID